MAQKGLGDTIEIITTTLGINKVMPKDCGCNKRKAILNKLVPYKKNIPSDEDAIRVIEEQVKEVMGNSSL